MEYRKIAILQPLIPHYRYEFFYSLNKIIPIDVFSYEKNQCMLYMSNYGAKTIYSIKLKGFLLYNPFVFLSKKYTDIVFMLNYSHLSTLFLLLINRIFHYKRIILWGHGISVKRYMIEEKKCDWKLKFMIALSDGLWLYTDKEVTFWRKVFPRKAIVSLNNTISGIDKIVRYVSPSSKLELRKKYGIKEKCIFLFCARFNSYYRRIDLLLDVINKLDKDKYGFVIIGNGDVKPDFSIYKNIYDMGDVYERDVKNDLFSLADIYFQPGWVGLSIVEAMGYGLPIFTFKRSETIKQCVEYSYIIDEFNGLIFESVDDFILKIESLSVMAIDKMGHNARCFVKDNLSMKNMVASALSIL